MDLVRERATGIDIFGLKTIGQVRLGPGSSPGFCRRLAMVCRGGEGEVKGVETMKVMGTWKVKETWRRGEEEKT